MNKVINDKKFPSPVLPCLCHACESDPDKRSPSDYPCRSRVGHKKHIDIQRIDPETPKRKKKKISRSGKSEKRHPGRELRQQFWEKFIRIQNNPNDSDKFTHEEVHDFLVSQPDHSAGDENQDIWSSWVDACMKDFNAGYDDLWLK